MSVTRRHKGSAQMSITSLIDILTILLLFVMVNVSSDPDFTPDDVELEESIINEEIDAESEVITLNVSYTGLDKGVITYTNKATGEPIEIMRLEEINNTNDEEFKNLLSSSVIALDEQIYAVLGDNNEKPIVVKIKAHKKVPFKYINVVKTLLLGVWNGSENKVPNLSKANNFVLYFATSFIKAETDQYRSVLSDYGLGG